MKSIVEKLNKDAKSSFVLQKDVYPYYPTPWHHHPEYELVLVLKSSGIKIIGDYTSNFSDGDLVFIGPNLPHSYRNDDSYFDKNSKLTAEAIVIHFTTDFLGKDFFTIPEMDTIVTFLHESVTGFSISGKTRKLIAHKLTNMLKISGAERIIELLTILNILATTNEKTKLASTGFVDNFKFSGSEQITKACDFVMKNFKSEIALKDVAKEANMSTNAFCSFFKSRTRKTFVTFLNEIRIGYACKLLNEDNYTISEICYQCGFKNLSNFNRQFRKIVKKTPKQYKLNRIHTNVEIDINI